ncbi:MAG: alkaline phosphatase family protein [Thermoanaerobaculia bacterium]
MRRNRFLSALLIAIGMAGLLYILVSLFVPSPRRLIFGVDKRTGEIRMAHQNIAFLPPHRYYRLNFAVRNGAAAHEGVTWVRSQEGVPVKVTYHLRFGIDDERMSDAMRLVREGWSAWIRARVAEAISAISTKIPVEEMVSPSSEFAARRDVVRRTVAQHLARSGLDVSSFELERIEVDREALLRYKRMQLRRQGRGPVARVAMIGLDGADWDLIRELIIDGRMPNLDAIIDAGTSGVVQPVQPTIAPVAWTTLATGLSPDRHGVIGFFQGADGRTPMTSLVRRAPALWDIAPAFGRSTIAVNWWTAWPPTSENLVVYDTPVEHIPAALHPPSLAPVVQPVAIPEATIDFRQMSRFVNVTESDFRRAISSGNPNDPIVVLRSVLAKTWTDHRAAIALFKKQSPLLTMVLYDGTDVVNHLFGPYHPPKRAAIPFAEYRKYWPTVANYYAEIDRLIGEWVNVLPTDTTLLIVSPYGMTWGPGRPTKPPAGDSALAEHGRNGIFVAFGNHIDPARPRRALSVYDIAPTILAILGLPASSEMNGSLVEWAFNDLEPVTAVRMISYSEVVAPDPLPVEARRDGREYLASLRAVGHVVDERRQTAMALQPDENVVAVGSEEWGRYAYYNNLGVQLQRQEKTQEAIRAFQRAIDLNPGRSTPFLNLTMALAARGHFSSAENVFFAGIQRGVADPEAMILAFAAWHRERGNDLRAINVLRRGKEMFPSSAEIAANLGSALAAEIRYTEAVAELERALALRPSSTLVLNTLGQIYVRRQEYPRALDYWNRSLAIDPSQPEIRKGVEALRTRL